MLRQRDSRRKAIALSATAQRSLSARPRRAMRALVGGKIFDANYQGQWLDSLEPQDPSKPLGQKYGYGFSQITFGPNSLYFHGGEMPGYTSFMGYDPVNDVTLIIWTSLTISLDGQPTVNLRPRCVPACCARAKPILAPESWRARTRQRRPSSGTSPGR